MRAISLFSGAGGMDVGFERAGFDVIWSNDFDKDACATYKQNFSGINVHGDINNYIQSLATFEDIDLVFGGPPCQGFSVAGKMDPDDERSQLVMSFMKVVEKTSPRAFVMENVKSLATLKKFSDVRKRLFWLAHKMGYQYELIVLNSKEFGVPQNRERMFFVAIKDGSHFSFKSIVEDFRKPERNVRQTIEHLGKSGSENNARICKAKITNAAKPVLRKSPYAGMLFNGQGRPANPDTPSCTLHASMGGNRTPIIDEKHLHDGGESWVVKYHKHLMEGGNPYKMHDVPNHLRRLTVDEAILIQTFPKDFIFEGSQSSLYRQIGNAVPCDLAYAVARGVRQLLKIHEETSPEVQQCKTYALL